MNEQRQARLDEVLAELRTVQGVAEVWSDDFNSTYIDIFLRLTPKHGPFHTEYGGSNVLEWAVPLRSVNAGIRRACKKVGVDFNRLDWPEMQYYSIGHGEQCKGGYDQDDIKIEVLIPEPSAPPKPRDPQMVLGERA